MNKPTKEDLIDAIEDVVSQYLTDDDGNIITDDGSKASKDCLYILSLTGKITPLTPEVNSRFCIENKHYKDLTLYVFTESSNLDISARNYKYLVSVLLAITIRFTTRKDSNLLCTNDYYCNENALAILEKLNKVTTDDDYTFKLLEDNKQW